MSPQTNITSIPELQRHENDILAAINGAQHGAELMIVDPFRFLREHGFVVSAALQGELQKSAPALAKTAPPGFYERIEAGRAALINNFTWHIRSLGVE